MLTKLLAFTSLAIATAAIAISPAGGFSVATIPIAISDPAYTITPSCNETSCTSQDHDGIVHTLPKCSGAEVGRYKGAECLIVEADHTVIYCRAWRDAPPKNVSQGWMACTVQPKPAD